MQDTASYHVNFMTTSDLMHTFDGCVGCTLPTDAGRDPTRRASRRRLALGRVALPRATHCLVHTVDCEHSTNVCGCESADTGPGAPAPWSGAPVCPCPDMRCRSLIEDFTAYDRTADLRRCAVIAFNSHPYTAHSLEWELAAVDDHRHRAWRSAWAAIFLERT